MAEHLNNKIVKKSLIKSFTNSLNEKNWAIFYVLTEFYVLNYRLNYVILKSI